MNAPACEMCEFIGVPVERGGPMPGVPLDVRRPGAGETLILEGAVATSVHVVRTGSFKAFRTAGDGYERVGLMHRGDLAGCDALAGDRHLMGVAALEDSKVHAIALPDF
ncbi:cyclic nucleotide-binding domain-containing protein [Variovorax sp. J22R133]|uniref:cyclic nucleotide-binding domain-containing protein n=1 Tax=Variovorax brevis TaxID=3053503 RepID=UPI0025784BD6|nr:cyclic nucleotide-binding domain-containing protein [Variovorax sp. J22R133]MDM0117916.1 cyclic nucleotide-binding domain-containing protein [Variovorax sp. J22R133]